MKQFLLSTRSSILRTCLGFLSAAMATFLSASLLAAELAYVPNQGDGTVSVIDTGTDTVVATIDTGVSWATGVAIHPDGGTVYVTHIYSDTVSVIDARTNTVKKSIPVHSFPHGIDITPDGHFLYVACSWSDSVAVIDTLSNNQIANIPVGENPTGVAIHPSGSEAYITANERVYVIDVASNSVVAEVETPVQYVNLFPSLTSDGATLYVPAYDSSPTSPDQVMVIDTASRTVTGQIGGLGTNAFASALSPSGDRLYVTNNSVDTVTLIDTASKQILAVVPVGNDPFGIALTADGSKAYVANVNSDTVSVISTATQAVVATIPVGSSPAAMGRFIGIIPELGLGGSVRDYSLRSVRCVNLTTGEMAHSMIKPGESGFDCKAAGLVINPGDHVRVHLDGHAQ